MADARLQFAKLLATLATAATLLLFLRLQLAPFAPSLNFSRLHIEEKDLVRKACLKRGVRPDSKEN